MTGNYSSLFNHSSNQVCLIDCSCPVALTRYFAVSHVYNSGTFTSSNVLQSTGLCFYWLPRQHLASSGEAMNTSEIVLYVRVWHKCVYTLWQMWVEVRVCFQGWSDKFHNFPPKTACSPALLRSACCLCDATWRQGDVTCNIGSISYRLQQACVCESISHYDINQLTPYITLIC